MILHLDTHVIVWLYAGDRSRIPSRAAAALDHAHLVYSPVSGLEITYLYEIGRVTVSSQTILDYLRDRIGLTPDDTPFLVVAREAERLSWTRDPFDRMITAAAAVHGHPLVTADEAIRSHYEGAVWE